MASATEKTSSKVLNFNLGILGHIDSGKTSLAKVLSTVASTASFDKNPQSVERGITLDLGFSSFNIPIPESLKDSGYDSVQFTLVDCPGHASLIRTIIGGAQIIDLMILVVDITKGIQTQTAECLVIGEITCKHMMVVLNKCDLIEDSKRDTQIAKMTKRIQKTLETTQFKDSLILPVAAKPGGPESESKSIGIDALIKELSNRVFLPVRSSVGPFVCSVDHCFGIRGQGTVMTGTILSGSVNVNDNIEIPLLKVTKKVKSMQMFHKPVQTAKQGDRVGICVTQFDPKSIERCLVCTPGALPTIHAGIFRVHKVKYHKLPCLTGAKLHISIGHETVMAKVTFFGTSNRSIVSDNGGSGHESFDYSMEYHYQNELHNTMSHSADSAPSVGATPLSSDTVHEYQYGLLEFERPVICSSDAVIIGSRLDVDAYGNMCRIALHGRLISPITDKDYDKLVLPKLKIFKTKTKEGVVERVQDEYCVIGKGLFKRETKIQSFVGLAVTLSTGERGVIEGGFGTTGKYRINIRDRLKPQTLALLPTTKKKTKSKETSSTNGDSSSVGISDTVSSGQSESVKISLSFKRFIYDRDKRMIQ